MKKNSSPSSSSSSSSSTAPTIPAAIERDRSAQNDNNNYTSHEAISRRAYEIWQEAGGPAGRETEFWLEAEQQLAAVATANQMKKN